VELVRETRGFAARTIEAGRGQGHGIVGCSRAMGDVIRRIEVVAATRSTVLITGETGTGKELAARAVHNLSAQHDMPFIKVNCAAIPETLLESELFGHVRGAFTDATTARKGKFALANRGSLFLDEIGTMSVGLQAKLLRVLQEREIEPLGAERTERVDIRVIAATNRNLVQLVDEGRFLEDLYYRLHVIPIEMPPLRERPEDISPLANYFIGKHARLNGKLIARLDDEVIWALQQQRWPGNVRELENAMERAVVLSSGPSIAAEAIVMKAAPVRSDRMPSLNIRRNVEWIERETIRCALRMSSAKRDAAHVMGISPRALTYYLNKYPSIEQESRMPARRAFSSDSELAVSAGPAREPGASPDVLDMFVGAGGQK
jgi:transcriptional regulator with GAF, ATPase, and Fis domain